MIIGNKCDKKDERAVTIEQVTKFAEENNLAFMETSAADSTNVEPAFEFIV